MKHFFKKIKEIFSEYDEDSYKRLKILLVIFIISIIFAVKIPIFFIKQSENLLKNDWQVTFGILSQAYMQIIGANEGSTSSSENIGSEELALNFKNTIGYVRKSCNGDSNNGEKGKGSSVEGCWHITGNWNYLNGRMVLLPNFNIPGFILKNGAFVILAQESMNCEVPVGTYTRCGYMLIDVNGFNGPNTVGKDIFGLSITQNLLVPFGIRGYYPSNKTCLMKSKSVDNTGWGCSASAFVN